MGALDLTGVRAVFDDLMGSSIVRVNRRVSAADGDLDDSGNIVLPEAATVYQGPGLILPIDSATAAGAILDPAVATRPADSSTTHRMLLPLSATGTIRAGHVAQQTVVDPVLGDTLLQERRFRVTEIPTFSAVSVLRIVYLKPDDEPDAPTTTPDGP